MEIIVGACLQAKGFGWVLHRATIAPQTWRQASRPRPDMGNGRPGPKVFVNAERLSAIRSERKAGSKYASLRQCDMELRALEAMYNKHNIPYLDATELSIEEISTRVLAMKGLERRLQ